MIIYYEKNKCGRCGCLSASSNHDKQKQVVFRTCDRCGKKRRERLVEVTDNQTEE